MVSDVSSLGVEIPTVNKAPIQQCSTADAQDCQMS
jgi:hypothetical protein